MCCSGFLRRNKSYAVGETDIERERIIFDYALWDEKSDFKDYLSPKIVVWKFDSHDHVKRETITIFDVPVVVGT